MLTSLLLTLFKGTPMFSMFKTAVFKSATPKTTMSKSVYVKKASNKLFFLCRYALLVAAAALTMIAAMQPAFAATVSKQKKCSIVIKDADSLELNKRYLVEAKNKDKTIKVKIKVAKKLKKSALAKIPKKYCKLKLIGLEVLDLKGQPIGSSSESTSNMTSTSSTSTIYSKAQLGYYMGTITFSKNTTLNVSGLDISLLGYYNLALGGLDVPLGAGVNIIMLDGSLADDFGTIASSGSITSLRLETGVSLKNIISSVDLNIGAGVDVGVSSSAEAVFTSEDAATVPGGFPGDYNDSDGAPLGEEISSTGETGVGFFLNVEAMYGLSPSFKVGAFGGFRLVAVTFPFEQAQPFVLSSDPTSTESLENESIPVFFGGLSTQYNF